MTVFSFLPIRVIGLCSAQTADCGLQTGGNMQMGGRGGGILPNEKDVVFAIPI